MKVIAVANQKGGVSKTTVSVQLALWLGAQGLRVVVVDLDPQANTSSSLSEAHCMSSVHDFMHSGKRLPNCKVGVNLLKTDRISHAKAWESDDSQRMFLAGLDRLKRSSSDIVIIDTAPALDRTLQAALLGSDHVLVPVRLEVYSIMGLKELLETIGRTKVSNRRLNFLGMLPTMKDARTARHRKFSQDLIEAYGEEYVLPVSIGLRGSIPDATLAGVAISEVKGSSAKKAAAEFHELGQWLTRKIGIEKEVSPNV